MRYCDSKELERNWFHWLLSSSVPSLEPYRKVGLLWTRILGEVKDDAGQPLGKNKPIPDPLFQTRAHCLICDQPRYFNSYNGKPTKKASVFQCGTPTAIQLNLDEIPLLSPDESKTITIARAGYIQELPTDQTWHAMLDDIQKICHGIAKKFYLQNEEEREDLASEAFLQVSNKLVLRKLVYTPGRASVFNLLTTTIHRIMYSILNRGNKQRSNTVKLASGMLAGILPTNIRSLRVPHRSLIRTP